MIIYSYCVPCTYLNVLEIANCLMKSGYVKRQICIIIFFLTFCGHYEFSVACGKKGLHHIAA